VTAYLNRLAHAAAGIRYEALPASTVAAARLVLLDTLGAIVGGSALPASSSRSLASGRPSHEGRATLLRHRMRTDAFWAALANATAGVALEMDEGNRLGGGHPAIHVIPGALAVAEERGIDGQRLLEAIVAGYEVGSRLGGATTTRPNVHRTEPGAPSAPRWPWHDSARSTERRCVRSSTSPPR
jgi:2-methylcitrate dehydratase PrpD